MVCLMEICILICWNFKIAHFEFIIRCFLFPFFSILKTNALKNKKNQVEIVSNKIMNKVVLSKFLLDCWFLEISKRHPLVFMPMILFETISIWFFLFLRALVFRMLKKENKKQRMMNSKWAILKFHQIRMHISIKQSIAIHHVFP